MPAYGDDEKAFFEENGCSHFHMSREWPERYERYRALQIPKSVEREWAREYLDDRERQIAELSKSDEIALAHSSFVDIAGRLDPHDAATRTANLTRAVAGRLKTPLATLIFAETLIGRSRDQTDGAVFRAHQAGLRDVAQELLDEAMSHIAKAEAKNRLLERCDKARRDADRLAAPLNLSSEGLSEAGVQTIVYLVGSKGERKLIDATVDEVAAGARSLAWKRNSSVTLQRMPLLRLGIDRIAIERARTSVDDPAKMRFDVSWLHAAKSICWIEARIESLDLAVEILAAAMDGDEARLRELADWSFPPALEGR